MSEVDKAREGAPGISKTSLKTSGQKRQPTAMLSWPTQTFASRRNSRKPDPAYGVATET